MTSKMRENGEFDLHPVSKNAGLGENAKMIDQMFPNKKQPTTKPTRGGNSGKR
jgi:hypothetical protein